jgi:hypothetical protein
VATIGRQIGESDIAHSTSDAHNYAAVTKAARTVAPKGEYIEIDRSRPLAPAEGSSPPPPPRLYSVRRTSLVPPFPRRVMIRLFASIF